jgi:hypothetical protein
MTVTLSPSEIDHTAGFEVLCVTLESELLADTSQVHERVA